MGKVKNVVYGLYCVCEGCNFLRPGVVRYVGQTQETAETRFYKHAWTARNGGPWAVSAWIRKHGEENIRHITLEVCETSEGLDAVETRWIEELGTLRTEQAGGLNAWPGGRSVRGYKWSEEQRARVRGRPSRLTPEVRERLAELGRTRNGETASNSKLKEREVIEIKKRLWGGETALRIAEDYPRVTSASISMISKGVTWKSTPWPIGPRRESFTGKFQKGERVGAKLTPEIVRAIRKEHAGVRGENRRLAEKYGVTPESIGQIIRRQTWKDVE